MTSTQEKELRHVEHDVNQMHDSALIMAELHGPGGEAVQWERWPRGHQITILNSLAESMALHVRSLATFLDRYRQQDRDLDPRTYAPNWPEQGDVLSTDDRAWIDRRLAHLSKERPEPVDGNLGWWNVDIVIKVLERAEEFYGQISKPFLKPGWKANLNGLIAASTLRKTLPPY